MNKSLRWSPWKSRYDLAILIGFIVLYTFYGKYHFMVILIYIWNKINANQMQKSNLFFLELLSKSNLNSKFKGNYKNVWHIH